MMVASVDTRTGRTILFGLPRNLQRVPFPAGSAMARRVPPGLPRPVRPVVRRLPAQRRVRLRAQLPRGRAARSPTTDPGLNLLHSTVETMLGLKLDYYVEVNMAGFAAIIDALGGLTVDVGPEPLPVGGHHAHRAAREAGPLHPRRAAAPRRRRTRWPSPGRGRTATTTRGWAASAACCSTSCSRRARRTCSPTSRAWPRPPRTACRPTSPRQVLPALVKVADSAARWRWRACRSTRTWPTRARGTAGSTPRPPGLAFMQKVVRDTHRRSHGRGAPNAAATSAPPTGTRSSASAREPRDGGRRGTAVGTPGADARRHLPRPVVLTAGVDDGSAHARPGASARRSNGICQALRGR